MGPGPASSAIERAAEGDSDGDGRGEEETDTESNRRWNPADARLDDGEQDGDDHRRRDCGTGGEAGAPAHGDDDVRPRDAERAARPSTPMPWWAARSG